MNSRLETVKKFTLAYRKMCKPLCKELELPQTALDILLFLGNNPAYSTARDIVEIRRIKANLVSMHVDRWCGKGTWSGNRCRETGEKPSCAVRIRPSLSLQRGGSCKNIFSIDCTVA